MVILKIYSVVVVMLHLFLVVMYMNNAKERADFQASVIVLVIFLPVLLYLVST